MSPYDIKVFIREAAQKAPIFAISIQGFEPLLHESLAHTCTILAMGRELGIPANLVTNGVRLRLSLPRLTDLEPCTLGVSLDSATAYNHDKMRGVEGCWMAAVDGIRHARQRLQKTDLAVISVLMPSRLAFLMGMPELLSELGVENWIVNPLMQIGKNRDGGPVSGQYALIRDLVVLEEAAAAAGVRLLISDEFGQLSNDLGGEHENRVKKLPLLSLPRDVQIFRLLPSGQCSTGHELLRRLSPSCPRWIPQSVHAGVFLEQLAG